MDRKEALALLAQLVEDADRICLRFGLRYRVIEAERANVKRRYGICYSDGTIKIRLRNLRTDGALRYSSLIATLCHELAHLRHFDHGPQFEALNQRLLQWCRVNRIYRPRALRPRPLATRASIGQQQGLREVAPAEPEQLSLF
jgi:predicted metal-dependent hydrolase